jgi:hypothetical protein
VVSQLRHFSLEGSGYLSLSRITEVSGKEFTQDADPIDLLEFGLVHEVVR